MAFAITQAAVDAIRQRLSTSTVQRPIAAMIDCSDSLPVSREMGQAILRKAPRSELREIAKREHRLNQMEFHLTVAVYSKSQHPFWTHATIKGVPFALPLWVRLALRNWTLDFEDNRFLLRSGAKVKYTLSETRRASAA